MAHELGINITHVYRAIKGDYTPMFVRTLRKRGYIPPKPKRTRFTAEADKETIEAIDQKLERIGKSRRWMIENVADWLDRYYEIELAASWPD
jgi:hypothetical protein